MDLSRYRHFSFDLDGTLVHTVPAYRYKIVPLVIQRAAGTVLLSHRAIDRFWFESGRDKIIAEEFGVHPDDFWFHFRALDTADERSSHTHAYPDSEAIIRHLKTQGKLVSIVTGAPQWIAEMEIAKMNGVPLDFFLSLAWNKFGHKPNPAGLQHTLETMNTDPAETVYIGNSNEDAQFAHNAGVDFIYLERKEHDFRQEDNAIATISSLTELIKFL